MIITPHNYQNPTYIVCGTPFSGTSVVAGTLRLLGVYMGSQFTHPGTHQDEAFCTPKSTRQRRLAIASRDLRFDSWGFKAVDMQGWIRELLPFIREPVFLFCSRSLADTLENSDSPYTLGHDHDLIYHLKESSFWHHFFLTNAVPWCVLKYQTEPELLLQQIIEFTGLSPADTAKALEFNNPRKGYQEITDDCRIQSVF